MFLVRDMIWIFSIVFMVIEKGEFFFYAQGFFVFTEEVIGFVSVVYDWLAGKFYMFLFINFGMVSFIEFVYDNKFLICKLDN